MFNFLSKVSARLQKFWVYNLGDVSFAGGGASVAMQGTSGFITTPQTATSVPAVFAAITVIASAGATLSIDVRKRFGSKRFVDYSHPANQVLNGMPDGEINAMNFRQAQYFSALGWGNSYAEIVRTGGQATAMFLLDPTSCLLERDTTSQKLQLRVYKNSEALQRQDKRDSKLIPYGDVFHFRGLSRASDGLLGLSPIQQCKRAISLGIAASEYLASIYQNQYRPNGHFEQTINFGKNKAPLEAFKAGMDKGFAGARNAGKTPIIPFGFAWKETPSLSIEDLGFIASMKFTDTQVAQMFNLSPDKIGDYSTAKFSSPQGSDINFWRNSMSQWLTAYEQESMKLFAPLERVQYSVKHDMRDRLRGDEKSMGEYIHALVQSGALSVNDINVMLDQNQIDETWADDRYIPLNMIPARLIGSDAHVQLQQGDTKKNATPQPTATNALPAPEPQKVIEYVATNDNKELASKAQTAFAVSLSRCIRKECNAMRRASGKPETFLTALDTFYTAHKATLTEQTESTYSVWSAVTGNETPLSVVVERCIADSTQDLLSICGSEPDATLAKRIEPTLKKWEAEKANTIIGQLG